MDPTLLNLAIPSLTVDLKPTAAHLLSIVDIYGFLAAGALLMMGTLGSRIGRRRLLFHGGDRDFRRAPSLPTLPRCAGACARRYL